MQTSQGSRNPPDWGATIAIELVVAVQLWSIRWGAIPFNDLTRGYILNPL